MLGALAVLSGAATEAGEAIGASIIALLLTGGSATYLVVRSLAYAGQAGGQATSDAWIKSWSWAAALGTTSDTAMRRARELQAAIWRANVGAPWVYTTFTSKARTRAQLLVGAAWLLLGLGALFVGIGIYQAFEAYSQQTAPTSPAPIFP